VVHYKEGEVDGKAFFYFDKYPETKKAEMNFDQDLLDGLYTEYWSNGAVKAELEYKNGKLNGSAKYYYPTGKLKIEGKYKKGNKKGKWTYYDPKGKVIKKERHSGFLF
jgi:antitoxin component YwqK of YwqJK toxin-antitoxin module